MLESKTKLSLLPLLLAAAFLPASPAFADDLFGQLGDAANTGRLEAEARLREGSVPVMAGYSFVVKGAPATRLRVGVREGKVEDFRYTAPDETVLLVGKGLRPDVVLTHVEADSSGTVTSLDFHGRGLGRIVVSLFKPLVRKKVRQVRLHTALADLLRGNLVVAETEKAAAPKPAPAAPPAGAPAAPAAAAGPGFMDLVDEVRLLEFRLSAFPGKPLAFGEALSLVTGGGDGHDPLEVRVDEAV